MLEELIKEHRLRVQEKIDEYLDSHIENQPPLHQSSRYKKFHRQICADYPDRGGKYIRSLLCTLTCEAMEGKREKAFITAVALEVCQNWLLIHDDIEDDSLERRGEATLHRKYNLPLAINAGDSLHLIMWKILCDNRKELGENQTFLIMEEFYRMLSRTAIGQTAELENIYQNKFEMTEEDYFSIVDNKTGYYTVNGPMRLGALLAEGNGHDLQQNIFPQLDQLGCYVGRIFQITDDILDLTSDFKGLKKQLGNDIYESKRTLPLIHLLKEINAEERKEVIGIMSKPRKQKKETEVDYIIRLMKNSGSLDYARSLVGSFHQKAKMVLEKIPFFTNLEATRKWNLFIDFLEGRQF